MKTKIEEMDGKFVATLEGEMDTAAAIEAEEILKPLYNSNGKDVIIDCTNFEYIASRRCTPRQEQLLICYLFVICTLPMMLPAQNRLSLCLKAFLKIDVRC